MPLVGGGSTTGVTVEIQGKIDDLTKKLNLLDKDLDQFAARNKAASTASVTAAKTASMSWTDFRSMYSTVLDVVRVGQQVWEKTGGEFVKYADSVRDVSRSLGSTTEEASRLIQVADDVFISYDKLTIAMKMAQKQGIDPSIEGLAKLSDKYLSLAPGVERTQFLLKTFGKSGAEMGKLMEKGGDGIRSASAAISDNLILSKQATQDALKYKQAQDELNDALMGLQIAAGKFATPAMTDFLIILKADTEAITTFASEVLTGKQSMMDWAAEIVANNPITLFGVTLGGTGKKVEELTGAIEDGNTPAVEDNKEAIKAATDALDAYKKMLDGVSQANKDAESFMQSYADFNKGYAKDHEKAVQDEIDAEEKLNEARSKKAKTDTQKEAKANAIKDATEGVEEAKKAVKELEATWHESTQKMIYDMVLAKVSVDGLTDAEFKATQDLAVQMGIRSQADADAAKVAMDKATSIADGIAMQEDVMSEKSATDARLLELENAKAAAAGETTAAIVNGSAQSVESMRMVTVTTEGEIYAQNRLRDAALATAAAYRNIGNGGTRVPTPGKYNEIAPQGGPIGSENKAANRDSGGSGVAGTTYMIGTGAQPELFTPSTNGTFTPANKVGSVYNITVNNPRKETAENSIREALKNLSYLGVAG